MCCVTQRHVRSWSWAGKKKKGLVGSKITAELEQLTKADALNEGSFSHLSWNSLITTPSCTNISMWDIYAFKVLSFYWSITFITVTGLSYVSLSRAFSSSCQSSLPGNSIPDKKQHFHKTPLLIFLPLMVCFCSARVLRAVKAWIASMWPLLLVLQL